MRGLVLALAVIAVAAGMAPVARPAGAQVGPTFTVGLQPGWNLVGWVEPEASVQHLFDTIPRAEVVFAWDAKEQRFRGAYADPPLNAQGDLEQLKPGMGLWLWLGGNDPFAWTRPLSREPTVDFVSLHEGWNLVAWTGLDGVAAATGLEHLADDLARVMMWDAAASQYVEYDATDSAPDEMPLLRRGGALWISASAEVHWEQAVVIDPTVVFHGEVSEAQQGHVRARVDHVVAHYAQRLGTYLSNTAFHFTANDALFRDVTAAVKGAASSWNCLDYGAEAGFLNLSCDRLEIDWVYFFAVRSHLTVPVARELWWTIWGWDRYERAFYQASLEDAFPASYESYEVALEEFRRRASLWESPVQRPLHPSGPSSPEFAFLGVDWLVRRAGTYSIHEFLQAIPWAENWEDAFTKVFGLTPGEFYDEFESYVGTIVPPRWDVSGSFFDQDGDALGKWLFRTVAQPVEGHGESRISHVIRGFRMKLAAGIYNFSVGARCDFQTIPLGWYDGEGGLTANQAEAGQEVVDGSEISFEVKLPRLPSEVSPLCELPPRLTISGVVTGPDGQPVPDIYLATARIDLSTTTARERFRLADDATVTADDGTFSFKVLDEITYWIQVESATCEGRSGLVLGWYDAVAGFARLGSLAETGHVVVDGKSVTGIHVRLPEWEYSRHTRERQRCAPSDSESGR